MIPLPVKKKVKKHIPMSLLCQGLFFLFTMKVCTTLWCTINDTKKKNLSKKNYLHKKKKKKKNQWYPFFNLKLRIIIKLKQEINILI